MKPTNLYLKSEDLQDIEFLFDLLKRDGIDLADPRGGRKDSKSALFRFLVNEELKRRGFVKK